MGSGTSPAAAALHVLYNIGVEIGQLRLSCFWCWPDLGHRRLDAVLPQWGSAITAYAIGAVSMFWFLGRLLRVLSTT